MKKLLVSTALLTAVAVLPCVAKCQEPRDLLVGVWQAKLQPDSKKIKALLTKDGMPAAARLVFAPIMANKIKGMIFEIEFRPDGTFAGADTLSMSEDGESDKRLAKHKTWKIINHTRDGIVVQVTTRETNGKLSRKVWQFQVDRNGGLTGVDADWNDAPFAAPKFARVQSAARPAAHRR